MGLNGIAIYLHAPLMYVLVDHDIFSNRIKHEQNNCKYELWNW